MFLFWLKGTGRIHERCLVQLSMLFPTSRQINAASADKPSQTRRKREAAARRLGRLWLEGEKDDASSIRAARSEKSKLGEREEEEARRKGPTWRES